MIDEKLVELSHADVDTLQTALETSWKAHEGENSVGVSWELFRDVEHAKVGLPNLHLIDISDSMLFAVRCDVVVLLPWQSITGRGGSSQCYQV